MQEFVDRLFKMLDIDEKYGLTSAEGHWPEYPTTIQELANKYNLPVPWLTLPGPRERWDNYRSLRTAAIPGWPEVPAQNLRDFVYFSLNTKERDDLKLSPSDPASFERLHQAYFKH